MFQENVKHLMMILFFIMKNLDHQGIDVSNLEVPAGHACKLCSYRMTASELEVLERLPEFEKVSFDEMQAVVM